MKLKLPIIGQVKTGNDAEPSTIVKEVKEYIEKDANLIGGFFEFNKNRLSDEKTISDKLLKANTGWVYRNNDVIAKEVAVLEFELYSVKIVKGEFEYDKIVTHPLLDALDRFNSGTTLSDGLYTTQSHKKLAGDAFWLLDWEGKKELRNIYILTPDKVELDLSSPSGKSDVLVKGYWYRDVVDGKEVKQYYKPEQIIHFRTPNPNNPFRGYGAVEAAAETIDTDNLAMETMKKFYQNGAIINFILTTEGKVTDEQLKRLRAEMKANYAGAANAYKTMILGGGLKPESIQPNSKEQELMAQLEWYRDKIMVLFGNSKASLGIVDDVNRATQESAIISWRKNSIKPEMASIVNTLNEFLVPKYGDNLILTFADPVGEDRTSLIEETVKLKNAGIIDNNEARVALDLETRPDPVNDLVNAEREQERDQQNLQNVDLKKILRKRGLYQKLHDYRVVKDEAKKLIKKTRQKKTEVKEEETHKEHPIFSDKQVWAHWEKLQSISDVHEERFLNKLKQYIGLVEKQVLANYPDNQPKAYNKQLIQEDDLITQASIDFEPILMDLAGAAGAEALKLIKQERPYLTFDIHLQIQTNVRKFAKSMLETERDKIVDIIEAGVREGLSIQNIRTNIVAAFDDFTRKQAELIARNESLRIANQATVDAWKQSGIVRAKQWLTAEDERVCPYCAPLNGKIVDLDTSYFKQGAEYYGQADKPLTISYESVKAGNLHVNCRCTVLPVLMGERTRGIELEQQLEEAQEYIKELEEFISEKA